MQANLKLLSLVYLITHAVHYQILRCEIKVDARLYVSADHTTFIHIHCLLVAITTAEGGL